MNKHAYDTPFLSEVARAAKPKAEQLREHRGLITINPSPTIRESTPSLVKHALWSPNCYVFGVKDKLKKLEKTQLFMLMTPNLSVDSILRFLLVMLQYVEQVYQIYW